MNIIVQLSNDRAALVEYQFDAPGFHPDIAHLIEEANQKIEEAYGWQQPAASASEIREGKWRIILSLGVPQEIKSLPKVHSLTFIQRRYKKEALVVFGSELRAIHVAIEAIPPIVYSSRQIQNIICDAVKAPRINPHEADEVD